MPDTFVALLQRQFEIYSDSRTLTFLNESGRHLVPEVSSLGELDRDARQIAGWLQSQPQSDRPVLLLFEPGIAFWRAFLGCLYAGVVAVPAPLPIDERSMNRLTGIFRDSECGLVLTTHTLRDMLAAGIETLNLDKPLSCVAVDRISPTATDSFIPPSYAGDAIAFLQYTSGSTGDPKGVAVTHGNLLSNAATIRDELRLTDETTLVGWIPHFHDMGLIGQLVGLLVGADTVAMSPVAFLKQPIRILKAINDYRGTISAMPNFAFDLIARRVKPEQLIDLDLSSWRIALNGAESVRRRTLERVNALLAPAGFAPTTLRPTYGMAEVTLMATVTTGDPSYLNADSVALEQNLFTPADDNRPITLVSCGMPARGIDLLIVDPQSGTALGEDEVGEIWLRSDSVASGYHNRPADTIERFHATTSEGEGPYLRTGDLGLLHENELYVTGRLKDLLIVNGRNLYPQDFEEFVQDVHPAVTGSRGCMISVDVDDAERLVLIQAIKSDLLGETSHAQLVAALKSAVVRAFDVPAPRVVLVDRTGIHLTTSGKLQRASMRDAYLKDELNDVIYEEPSA